MDRAFRPSDASTQSSALDMLVSALHDGGRSGVLSALFWVFGSNQLQLCDRAQNGALQFLHSVAIRLFGLLKAAEGRTEDAEQFNGVRHSNN
jgi:hypothetical protein